MVQYKNWNDSYLNNGFSITDPTITKSDIFNGVSKTSVLDKLSNKWVSVSAKIGTPNVAMASVIGFLSAMTNFVGVLSSRKVYEQYKRQEGLYIENANIQARRAQLRGDLALSSLRVSNELAQGKSVLGAAAAGGNLSGSFADLLIQNNKYHRRDEMSQTLETLWQVDNIKRSGYINAIQAAGQAKTLAYKNLSGALTGLAAFANGMGSALAKDYALQQEMKASSKKLDSYRETQIDLLKVKYGPNAFNSASGQTVSEAAAMNVAETVQNLSGMDSLETKLYNGDLLSLDEMDEGYSRWGTDVTQWPHVKERTGI